MATFYLCHAPLTLTLAPPNTSPSVNQVEDPGAITGNVWIWRVCGRVGDRVEAVLLHWKWIGPGVVKCRFDVVMALMSSCAI